MQSALKKVIGLMSGTSMDGIDVAVLETDGHYHNKLLYAQTFGYPADLISKLKPIIGKKDTAQDLLNDLERSITMAHAEACEEALSKFSDIELIGFHGQTIWHAPEEGATCQLGDGDLLARLTGIKVVFDFRSADMQAGGQGAPLLPIYHHRLAHTLDKPIAILNIGGVSNITYINNDISEIVGFDTGTGNALINDWVYTKTQQSMDHNGVLASQGAIDHAWVDEQMSLPYFDQIPPKSLDRDAFHFKDKVNAWSVEDGAATLTYFSAKSIARAISFLPEDPKIIGVTGGGRHNPVMIGFIQELLPDISIKPVEDIGWNGDALEAAGFAHFAMCFINNIPITYPNITGCKTPVLCGRLSS